MCVRRGLSGGISAGESDSRFYTDGADNRTPGLGTQEGLGIMLLTAGGFMLPPYNLTGMDSSTGMVSDA